MTSLARTRTYLRRAAFVAALGALMAPATAGASVHAHAAKKHKAKAPVVTRVTPMQVAIGQKLEIRGRYFLRGRNKNTVVFKRTGGKAIFVKAAIGTTKLLRLTVPAKLNSALRTRAGAPVPTRFRLRVLARKFGKRFTKTSRSPVVGPELPPTPAGSHLAAPDGDCDGDGIKNGAETDDDGDLLSDGTELRYKTDPCKADSDGDGVTDGYEIQSATDLNDDEYQIAQTVLPYPEKRPYPNALFADAGVDYDGDSLTLGEEFSLWQGSRDHAGLDPLSYSDGNQYSVYNRDASGHRPGSPRQDPYAKYANFFNWANAAGYGHVSFGGSSYLLLDFNHNGTVSTSRSVDGVEPDYYRSEQGYYDFDSDGKLSDDERDEDADGLTNYDETHGRMLPTYWGGCYAREAQYPVAYAGTDPVDADTDGDGVRDGADDQDHDDLPNVAELSRNAASGHLIVNSCSDKNAATHSPDPGRVNPFNPCLPDANARTCVRHPGLGGAPAPFDDSDYFVLN
jgi:Bacterial TSP3 repeat